MLSSEWSSELYLEHHVYGRMTQSADLMLDELETTVRDRLSDLTIVTENLYNVLSPVDPKEVPRLEKSGLLIYYQAEGGPSLVVHRRSYSIPVMPDSTGLDVWFRIQTQFSGKFAVTQLISNYLTNVGPS